ncbi:MAG: hypothetical protein RR235_02170 [Oscillospiraceae bacterium]
MKLKGILCRIAQDAAAKKEESFTINLPKLRFVSRLCRDYRFAIEIVV